MLMLATSDAAIWGLRRDTIAPVIGCHTMVSPKKIAPSEAPDFTIKEILTLVREAEEQVVTSTRRGASSIRLMQRQQTDKI
jgi:hypothetical protein